MKFELNQIGFKEIKEILDKKEQIFNDCILDIRLIKQNEFYGEIDQIFISYLLLFLKTNFDLKVKINFSESLDSSLFFKFAQQINQAKALYPKTINNNNFSISGSYIKKETGEINDIIKYNTLVQSGSFIPPLMIYKST
ncbi:MAG: hypothetical protein ACKVQV_01205, partial [Bacteroidia bacterium]